LNFDRRDGEAFRQQWEEIVDTGIEPFLVVVTSFNEWHEGTQIEPSLAGAIDGAGNAYRSYAPLQAEGYLELTRQLAEETVLSAVWAPRPPLRARLTTTSDRMLVSLTDGLRWGAPEAVSASAGVERFDFSVNEFGVDAILLTQALEQAEAGVSVEGVMGLLMEGECDAPTAQFQIGLRFLGAADVELLRNVAGEEMTVASFHADSENPVPFTVPCETLLGG